MKFFSLFSAKSFKVIISTLANVLSEIKRKLERAYNEEDWNQIEDLIDVLDTLVTIGDDGFEWEDGDDEID